MNCDKCHGWMEQRYHPQIYKKTKINEIKDGSLIIEKKIVNPKDNNNKEVKDKVSRISMVVE